MIQLYQDWLKNFLASQGMPKLGEMAVSRLKKSHLYRFPVDSEIAFRRIDTENLQKATIEVMDHQDLYAIENKNNKACPVYVELGRLFSSEKEAKEQVKFNEDTMQVVKATSKKHILHPDYTRYLMALTPDGFSFSPDLINTFEARGVFSIRFKETSAVFPEQVWVMLPTAMNESERIAVDIWLALREYNAINPLDLPTVIDELTSRTDELKTTGAESQSLWACVADEILQNLKTQPESYDLDSDAPDSIEVEIGEDVGDKGDNEEKTTLKQKDTNKTISKEETQELCGSHAVKGPGYVDRALGAFK